MRIQKFAARDMSDALAQVKRELGPDAMIISTRTVKRGLLATGIEVTAAIEDDSDGDGPSTMALPGPAAIGAGPSAMNQTASNAHSAYNANQAAAHALSLTQNDVDRIVSPLRSELAALRSVVRDWSAGPSLTELRRELVATRQVMSSALTSGQEPASLESLLVPGLVATSNARVVALIGPTGVGKTTTIAKLAARAALVEGKKVAMVSVDNYRIGAEAQLRTYADLIGTELVQIEDLATLGERIRRLRDVARFDQIFIDTAGRSPRDRAGSQKLAAALGSIAGLETHLAIQAESAPAQIDAIIEVHRDFAVDRLLFTKLDEARGLEELVRAPSRAGIPVTYLTTGQLVPEDLEEATLSRLETLARNGFIDTRFQEAA